MPDDLTITHEPGRCAGQPTVGPTRLGVHDIINRLRLYAGDVEAMLAAEEPPYTPEQIDAALAYYREHPAEIEAILEEQRADFEEGLAAQERRGA